MWIGGEVVQAHGWYQGAWHQIAKRKMLIGEQWRPIRFEDGEYRIGNPGEPAQSRTNGCRPMSQVVVTSSMHGRGTTSGSQTGRASCRFRNQVVGVE